MTSARVISSTSGPHRLATAPRTERIRILEGAAARSALDDPRIRAAWESLHICCPWATIFQRVDFVRAWYTIYAQRFEPVLVMGSGTCDQLSGVMALARTEGGNLVGAGDLHAEYQGWLAHPGDGDHFVQRALETLALRGSARWLRLQFLPQGTPLSWATGEGTWSDQVQLKEHPTGYMAVGAGSAAATELGKKRYRSRMKWLERDTGHPITFERLTNCAEISDLLDAFVPLLDFRQCAVNASRPFAEDPCKRAFHDVLIELGLAHVTVLRAGPHLISAHVNLIDQARILLALMSHAPQFGKYSPGTLHMLLLAQLLTTEDRTEIDLSPGGEYKTRFTSRSAIAHSVVVHFGRGRATLAIGVAGLRGHAKNLIEKTVGLERARTLRRLSVRLRVAGLRSVAKSAMFRVVRFVRHDVVLRLYTFDLDRRPPPTDATVFSIDSCADLLCYRSSERGGQTLQQFLASAMRRLEHNEHVFTVVESGVLAHYGWLIERQERGMLSEVGMEFEPGPDAAILYDFFTDPEFRGRGLYTRSLTAMLHKCAEIPGTRVAWIAVLSENVASRKVIERVGFQHVASFRTTTRFGRTHRMRLAVTELAPPHV